MAQAAELTSFKLDHNAPVIVHWSNSPTKQLIHFHNSLMDAVILIE